MNEAKLKTIIFEFLDDPTIEYQSTSKEDLIALGHAESKIDLIDKIAGQLAQAITFEAQKQHIVEWIRHTHKANETTDISVDLNGGGMSITISSEIKTDE